MISAINLPPGSPDFTYGSLIPVDAGETQICDAIPLLKSSLLIGRRESCDIVLRFPNVSALHCQMSWIDGQWQIEDVGSRNGTRVNGVRVEGAIRLCDGDKLSIAKHLYVFRYPA